MHYHVQIHFFIWELFPFLSYVSFISSNTFAACITVGIQFFLTVSVNKVNYINCFPNIKCPATPVAALLGHGVFRVLSATNLCWPQYCFRWLGSTPRGRQWPNQTFLSLLALRALKISFILPYTSPLSKKKKKSPNLLGHRLSPAPTSPWLHVSQHDPNFLPHS